MVFTFAKEGAPSVLVGIANEVDVTARITELKPKRGTSPHDRRIEVYTEATYLKYQSAVATFAAGAVSLEQWLGRRAVKEEERQETLMLLEAFVGTRKAPTVGALLLRSAWNNDVVIDFVVTNAEKAAQISPEISGVGALLIHAACSLAVEAGAKYVMAETAEHTKTYWPRFLPAGNELWREAAADVAFELSADIVSAGKWSADIHA